MAILQGFAKHRGRGGVGREVGLHQEGEVEEDSIQQQHNGVVVVEERGNPAGLRQAPWERSRKRGRVVPELRV